MITTEHAWIPRLARKVAHEAMQSTGEHEMSDTEMDRLMNNNNKRRRSQRAEDKAYMQHWYSCLRSTCQGPHPCSVFGLCPEGLRLDEICRTTENTGSEVTA